MAKPEAKSPLRDNCCITLAAFLLAAAVFFTIILALVRLPRIQPPPGAAESVNIARTGPAFEYSYGDWCDMLVNSGGWVGVPYVSCEESTSSVATCGIGQEDNWQWSATALQCGARRLGREQVRALLEDKWVAIAGDSITRFFFASLLRLLAKDSKQQIVFGHQDFEYRLPGNIRASFYWAPYTANLTQLLSKWTAKVSGPDFFVGSAGMWHMLHIGTPLEFEEELKGLRLAANEFSDVKVDAPSMTWFSITEVYPPKLKTEEKRRALTLQQVDNYNAAILNSKVLLPDGPFSLLDLHHLTEGCGAICTHDGLHYSNATYDAAVQIWANSLLA